MLDGKYIGKGAKIKLAGVQVGVADSEWTFKRGTGKASRSGMESDIKWPGKLDVSFKLTNNYFKGLYLGMLLGNTVNTGPGSPVTLLASIAAPSATPAAFT